MCSEDRARIAVLEMQLSEEQSMHREVWICLGYFSAEQRLCIPQDTCLYPR